MKEYEITITRYTRESCTVFVKAKNEDKAYEIAEKRFLNGDYEEEFENDLDEHAPGGEGYEIEVEDA